MMPHTHVISAISSLTADLRHGAFMMPIMYWESIFTHPFIMAQLSAIHSDHSAEKLQTIQQLEQPRSHMQRPTIKMVRVMPGILTHLLTGFSSICS